MARLRAAGAVILGKTNEAHAAREMPLFDQELLRQAQAKGNLVTQTGQNGVGIRAHRQRTSVAALFAQRLNSRGMRPPSRYRRIGISM